jgi:hypothetical protein
LNDGRREPSGHGFPGVGDEAYGIVHDGASIS